MDHNLSLETSPIYILRNILRNILVIYVSEN